MDSRQPKWWGFWKESPESEKEKKTEPEIREPIKEIVRLMINDRKRFVIQREERPWPGSEWSCVLILDTENGEEYKVSWTYLSYTGLIASGLSWATQKEQSWAVNTILDHRRKLIDRIESIKNARERNRLMTIYNKD